LAARILGAFRKDIHVDETRRGIVDECIVVVVDERFLAPGIPVDAGDRPLRVPSASGPRTCPPP
jgi:hypothetical protein